MIFYVKISQNNSLIGYIFSYKLLHVASIQVWPSKSIQGHEIKLSLPPTDFFFFILFILHTNKNSLYD